MKDHFFLYFTIFRFLLLLIILKILKIILYLITFYAVTLFFCLKIMRVSFHLNRGINIAVSNTRHISIKFQKMYILIFLQNVCQRANYNSPKNIKYEGDWFFKEIYNRDGAFNARSCLDRYQEKRFSRKRDAINKAPEKEGRMRKCFSRRRTERE